MEMAKSKSEGTISINRLEVRTLEIPIKGKTPVIPHKWSEKSKRMMPGHPDKPTEKVTKEKRKPIEEAEACLYKIGKTGIGLPATAFKAAIVDACRLFEKPSMVEAKQILFVEGEGPEQLVKIDFKKKELHEDTPRNANGSADLRYRYYLLDWSARIRVRYLPTIITRESILALVDAAGLGGIGDWRPSAPKSKTGTYGTWQIDESKEAKDVS